MSISLTPEQIEQELAKAPAALATKTHETANALAVAAGNAGALGADVTDAEREAWTTATRRRLLAESIGALAGIELGPGRIANNAELLAALETAFQMLMVAADESIPESVEQELPATITEPASEPDGIPAHAGRLVFLSPVYKDDEGNPAPNTPWRWRVEDEAHESNGTADDRGDAILAIGQAIEAQMIAGDTESPAEQTEGE